MAIDYPTYNITVDLSDQTDGTSSWYDLGPDFPDQLVSGTAHILALTVINGQDGGGADIPVDLTGATAESVKMKRNESGFSTTTLTSSAVIFTNTATFTIDKDVIPDSLASFDQSENKPTIIYWITIEDVNVKLYFRKLVTVIDENGLGTGVANPANATVIEYVPAVVGDWVFAPAVPDDVGEALDSLAEEITDNLVGTLKNIVEDTTPQLGGMLDVNGQSIGDGTLELIKFTETAIAVNELTIANAATAGAPGISATGDDSNIDLSLTAKGTGAIAANSDVDFNDVNGILNLQNLDLTNYSELTIATGAVTATQVMHKIDTESDAATDDLDTITLGSSNTILLMLENAARIVTLKDGTGNLDIGADVVMEADRVYSLAYNGTGWNIVGGTGSGGGTLSIAVYEDQKSSGTNGGSSSSGNQTRTLNTEVSDIDGIGALSANTVVLASGTYLVLASAPTFESERHKLSLKEGSNTLLIGTSMFSGTGGVENTSTISGVIIADGIKAYFLNHEIETARATTGLGVSGSLDTEVYATVTFIKIG